MKDRFLLFTKMPSNGDNLERRVSISLILYTLTTIGPLRLMQMPHNVIENIIRCLEPAESVCLGLSHSKFYKVHKKLLKEIEGMDRVPLDEYSLYVEDDGYTKQDYLYELLEEWMARKGLKYEGIWYCKFVSVEEADRIGTFMGPSPSED